MVSWWINWKWMVNSGDCYEMLPETLDVPTGSETINLRPGFSPGLNGQIANQLLPSISRLNAATRGRQQWWRRESVKAEVHRWFENMHHEDASPNIHGHWLAEGLCPCNLDNAKAPFNHHSHETYSEAPFTAFPSVDSQQSQLGCKPLPHPKRCQRVAPGSPNSSARSAAGLFSTENRSWTNGRVIINDGSWWLI